MTTRRAFLVMVACTASGAPVAPGNAGPITRSGLKLPDGHVALRDGDTISWNCPHTGDWEAAATNEAGFWCSPYPLIGDPRLAKNGDIVIPNEYGEWRMVYQGMPFVYGFFPMNMTRQPPPVPLSKEV